MIKRRIAPQIDSGSGKSSATATKQQMEELKILRDALVANFRSDIPNIPNSILVFGSIS